MARVGPEVADIFRRYGAAYRETHGASLCIAQRRVMSAIELCRTAALGGHVERCDRCDHQRVFYNSCRNRNCPKCQSLARAQWLEARQSELLDTPYFHVVFTMPQPIAAIALQNKEILYNILFRAAAETLRTIAADPKHLGAQIGFFAVLHTWGQTLCIALFRVGAFPLMARDGSRAGRISSCPLRCCRDYFADCL
jgi:Transposase zinc-binding domain